MYQMNISWTESEPPIDLVNALLATEVAAINAEMRLVCKTW